MKESTTEKRFEQTAIIFTLGKNMAKSSGLCIAVATSIVVRQSDEILTVQEIFKL